MSLRATCNPSAAVKVYDHRMRAVALRHRDIGFESRPKLDVVMNRANFRQVLIHHRSETLKRLSQTHRIHRQGCFGQHVEKLAFLFREHRDLRARDDHLYASNLREIKPNSRMDGRSNNTSATA